MRVFVTYNEPDRNAVGGIPRVLRALYDHLPEHGIEIITAPFDADIIAPHVDGTGFPRIDVLHLHGINWTGDAGIWNDGHHWMNGRIAASLRRARAVTFPAHWAAECVRRDMRIQPRIIPNGVTLAEWDPLPHEGYALWNKSRVSDVCTPLDAHRLAERGVPVHSTLALPNEAVPDSMTVIGLQLHREMKDTIRRAGVYLATTLEVHSLSVLEALASGVPVLGYRQGGTAETVTHREDGYLVEAGDIDGLEEGYHYCIANRARMSEAARAKAAQYDWRGIVAQYAALYQELHRTPEPMGAGIVIPCYGYAHVVARAVESALTQTHPAQVVVVNDGGAPEVSRAVALYRDRITYLETGDVPRGVAYARHAGIAALAPDVGYVCCLDADDELHSDYLSTVVPVMQADRGIGIGYTGLLYTNQAGRRHESAWPTQAYFDTMSIPATPPPNNIPSAAVFRRDVYARTGGYRQAMHPAEDYDLWVRMQAVGTNAVKVSNAALFIYHDHGAGAHRRLAYPFPQAWYRWARRAAPAPLAAPTHATPPVRSYHSPLVSVVIPVAAAHARHVATALESLDAQHDTRWEAIVVDDSITGAAGWIATSYPFVRYVRTGGAEGASIARNMGVGLARGKYVLFLDADDYLVPEAVTRLVAGIAAHPDAAYVYGGWITETSDGTRSEYAAPDYNAGIWATHAQHGVTVLCRKEIAEAVRFNPETRLYEDWEWFATLARFGHHGASVAGATYVYRLATGIQRELAEAGGGDYTRQWIKQNGGGDMGCCGKPAEIIATSDATVRVQLEFVGASIGSRTYHGLGGRLYIGSATPSGRFVDAYAEDVPILLRTEQWRVAEGATDHTARGLPNPAPATAEEDVPAEPAPVAPAKPTRKRRRKDTANE